MDHPSEAIADNLRCHREQRGLSLDQLAELTGVSKSMLRQIETGKSSPTISTLWKIANGLRLSFSALLCKESAEAEVKSFCAEKPLSEEEGRYRLFPLIPFSPHQPFEIYYFEIDPETEFHGEPHEGNVHEYLFVTHGTIRLSLEGKDYLINAGEFLKFQADRSHKYKCVSNATATAIMQVSYQP